MENNSLTNSYRVGSMFAGVGGICLAFINAGAKVVWANEIDNFACETYRKNFGDSYLVEEDIHNIDAEDIPEFDILTAGFPCQAFSIAGYQEGFKDDRGNLFFEIVRILNEKNPKAFLLENVKNLVNHDNGKTFDVISEYLKNAGYFFKHKVLDAMEYGNLPQTRERTFLVGFKNYDYYESFIFPHPIRLTKTIHDIIDVNDKKDDRYYYKENHQYYSTLKKEMTNKDTLYQWRRVYVRENKSNACPTLTANMGTGGHNVPLLIDNYGIRKLTPRETFAFQGFPASYKLPENVSNTQLYKQAGNSVPVPVVERIAEQMIYVMNQIDAGEEVEIEEIYDSVNKPTQMKFF